MIKISDENKCNRINTVIFYLNKFTFQHYNRRNNPYIAHLGPSFQVWVVSAVLVETSRTLQLPALKISAALRFPLLSDRLTNTDKRINHERKWHHL